MYINLQVNDKHLWYILLPCKVSTKIALGSSLGLILQSFLGLGPSSLSQAY